MKLEAYADYLVEFLHQVVDQAKAKGVIVGISGGVDSALVAQLAKKAFPNNHLAVWMPIDSSQLDWDCAQELMTDPKLNSCTLDLTSTFKQLVVDLKTTGTNISPLALANTKARLRMSGLYALGQTHQYLVLGTDNYDEWYMGYFTKYGDGGVDVVPLIHLLKGEVYQLAKLFQVPNAIIQRPPTAGLWDEQTDEKEIGFSYQKIDEFFLGQNQDPQLTQRLKQLHDSSAHKRQLAIQPKPFLRN